VTAKDEKSVHTLCLPRNNNGNDDCPFHSFIMNCAFTFLQNAFPDTMLKSNSIHGPFESGFAGNCSRYFGKTSNYCWKIYVDLTINIDTSMDSV